MRSNLVRLAVPCLSLVLANGLAWAANDPPARQGLFFAGKDGAVAAPVLGTTIEVRVTGIIARSKVTQIFGNPSREWVEGVYIFPLPEDAAVDTLRLKIGDRTLVGSIQEKQAARQTYDGARQTGTKATLIEQQRPDVFTLSVANVGPGETVEIELELQQVVRYAAGRFTLRFPMLVAPHGEAPAAVSRMGKSRLRLPPVLPRGSAPINPFAFHADLAPGFPLASLESPTHAIVVEKGKRLRYAVDLKDGMAPADGDLVLEWVPAVGKEPRTVFASEEVDGERYALLMVMPPDSPAAAASRLPRETVFVIDTSGSMSGTSIEKARQALLFALGRLAPGDRFNVIQFNSKARALFPQTVPASAGAIEQARGFVRALQADGGTEMLPAFEIALGNPAPPGLVPQVIFATDGQIEDEAKAVQFLERNLGDRRLFPIAIGPATNAALLRRLAALGRGSFTQIGDVGKVAQEMDALFSQLEAPMLRQIDVQWSDPSAEAWPERVPDLYLGEPLVVTARLRERGGAVTVSGSRAGSSWNDSVPTAGALKGTGIDKLWARRKIQALTDSLQQGADGGQVRRAVTELGLRHHLVTDSTSLVAVDESPTAPAGSRPVSFTLPVNAPRQAQDVVTVTAESPLLDGSSSVTSSVVFSKDLIEALPTTRDATGVETGQQERLDAVDVSSAQVYESLFLEKPRSPASEAEVKALCALVQRDGWKRLALDGTLAAAPSLDQALHQAANAGLLRGFLALVLEGKGCSKPPAAVLAEAEKYRQWFGVGPPS